MFYEIIIKEQFTLYPHELDRSYSQTLFNKLKKKVLFQYDFQRGYVLFLDSTNLRIKQTYLSSMTSDPNFLVFCPAITIMLHPKEIFDTVLIRKVKNKLISRIGSININIPLSHDAYLYDIGDILRVRIQSIKINDGECEVTAEINQSNLGIIKLQKKK